MKKGKRKIELIVQSGQYEQSGSIITVKYTTVNGLNRRISQLRREYEVLGDNWAG